MKDDLKIDMKACLGNRNEIVPESIGESLRDYWKFNIPMTYIIFGFFQKDFYFIYKVYIRKWLGYLQTRAICKHYQQRYLYTPYQNSKNKLFKYSIKKAYFDCMQISNSFVFIFISYSSKNLKLPDVLSNNYPEFNTLEFKKFKNFFEIQKIFFLCCQ